MMDNISQAYKDLTLKISKRKSEIAYTPKDAADIAKEILDIASKSGIYYERATPVSKIIKSFGIKLCRTDKMLPNMSGVIYAGGTTKEVYKSDVIIFTDNTEPLAHQRFVAVHELAHYLFDYIGNPNESTRDTVFVENYPRNDHYSEKETRADRFAAALLMPKNLFMRQYTMAIEESNNRIYTIKYLAGYFQVKESSIERRIGEVLYYGGY